MMKGYNKWNYRPYRPVNETLTAGTPFICRISPFDGGAEIHWFYFGDNTPRSGAEVCVRAENGDTARFAAPGTKFVLNGLDGNIDYSVWVEAGGLSSFVRILRPSPLPGKSINYLHPADRTFGFAGNSLTGPTVCRLPSEKLLMTMDFYEGRGGQNLTLLFHSGDEGETFDYVCDLMPCFWGTPFVHGGRLYMLATSTEYGDLLIGASDDEGYTWTAPTVILRGSGNRMHAGPHKSGQDVMLHGGRLWAAVDYGTWEKGGHAAGVASIDVNDDLLDGENWEISDFTTFDKNWPGAASGEKCRGILEGNLVISPGGQLWDILRYQIDGCDPSGDLAVILEVDPAQPAKAPRFRQIINFPGGLTKFWIKYDEKSGWYLALYNRIANPDFPMRRNVLSLSCSRDLTAWRHVCDLLNYDTSQGSEFGVQYPNGIIAGDDILYLSRTAAHGARNFHDSNNITFHRLRNFRDLLPGK